MSADAAHGVGPTGGDGEPRVIESRPHDPRYGPSALVTPSNLITLFRMICGPAFFAMVVASGPGVGLLLVWALLSATDKADGWLARRQGPTRSGAFLDPLADKLIMLGAMLGLVAIDRISVVPVTLIALREAAITAYRSYVGRRGVSVPAWTLAKWKTVLQDLAVGVALVPAFSPAYLRGVSAILWLSVALTLFTGAQYLLDGRRVISELA